MATKVDREKFFPGVKGADEKEKARKSRNLCTDIMQGEAVEIPGGKTREEAKEFCFRNRIGSPFRTELPAGVLAECASVTDKKGKSIRGKAGCKRLFAGRIAKRKTDKLLGRKVKLEARRVITKGSAYIQRTLKGDPLAAASTADKDPCRPAVRQGKDAALRPCHAELEFYPTDILAAKGITTRPGPYLRICGDKGNQPGGLYPVDSPEEAQKIMAKVCKVPAAQRLEHIRNELPPAGFGGLRQRMKHRRAKTAKKASRKSRRK